jgi:hypothetical protein
MLRQTQWELSRNGKQDFYAAFGLGEDGAHISTVDADGVALAAIQGLYAENEALAAENAALRARLDGLEAAAGGEGSDERDAER